MNIDNHDIIDSEFGLTSVNVNSDDDFYHK